MNTSSGRGPFSNESPCDTNLSSINTVSDTNRTVTVGSVPVTFPVVTPTKAAPRASVYGIRSPSVFTGYPVLTLPTLSGLARHKLSPPRLPQNISPRHPRSPASPRRSRSLANKTPLKGQPCIDQFYTKTVSSHSASMSHSSSLPLFGQSSSSGIRPCSVSLDRKRTEPDRVPVSPLLSRNQWDVAKMPTAKGLQSASTSAVGFNRSDKNSAGSDTQRDKCSTDTVSAVKTSLVEQRVSVDTMPEAAAIKNTLSATAEAQPESLKVSSTGCSNSTVSSRKYNKERTDACQSPLKISMPVLQKMRRIWEKNCRKSVKLCTSGDVTSEASVSLSSLAFSAELNNGCPSASLCATSASASAEVSASTTVASSHESSSASAVEVPVGDTVACMDTCDFNQQHVLTDGVEHDSSSAVSEPAVNMDVSNNECHEAQPSSTDSNTIDTATHKSPDCANTDQQIVLNHDVKNKSNNGGESLPVSAAEVDVSDELKGSCVNGRDNHVDIDTYALEDFTPVESKSFILLLLSQQNLQKHKSVCVCSLAHTVICLIFSWNHIHK